MMMSQDTRPAPFNQRDHVRYVGVQRSELPASQGNEPELVLVPGKEGIILLSSGALYDQGAAAIDAWHCRIQFQNGLQLDINPVSRADFEMARGD
jgi:hypothetical protein